MTYEDKASYDSTPPCTCVQGSVSVDRFLLSVHTALLSVYRALLSVCRAHDVVRAYIGVSYRVAKTHRIP